MQCKNGGWASFDKDNTKMIFQYIPFADHNAMLDPPTVDITGRILEMLASYGYTRRDKRVEKAIKFILQRAGAGRKLVRALGRELSVRDVPGAARAGGDRRWNHEPQVQQAAEWIRMVQNADGGWGETCGSYDDPQHARRLGRARLRRRRGRCWDCWRRARRGRIRWPREFAGCSSGSRRRWQLG